MQAMGFHVVIKIGPQVDTENQRPQRSWVYSPANSKGRGCIFHLCIPRAWDLLGTGECWSRYSRY